MIELKNLNKIYRASKEAYQALTDINLSISSGEVFGIIGKSGAGKSTLLRTLNLLERPTGGSVFINGDDITHLDGASLQSVRRHIGFIFQHFNLLSSRTVFDNIALPLEIAGIPSQEIRERVSELLNLIELTDHKNNYPKTLSGGQKQRVAIARALATNPCILLCDEVTSSLDVESTRNILNLLKRINQDFGKTIVLITHELDVIKDICNRCAVIDQGHLIEINDTVEIFTNPQHEKTKHLVDHAFHINLNKIDTSNTVVLLKFSGGDCEKPLITTLVKEYGLSVNILQADICNIKETSVGYTLCELQGDEESIGQAIQFIQSTSINIEVLNHV